MRVAFCWNPGHGQHEIEGHPERPDRVHRAVQALTRLPIWDRLVHVDPLPVPWSILEGVHDAAYLRRLRTMIPDDERHWFDSDTCASGPGVVAALEAVGSTLAVTEAVTTGRCDRGFAVVRPPGHHARPSTAMGFCLLANVAAGVRQAQGALGTGRIAIIDIDVHHGNGTQEIFERDPNIFFASLHQYPFYPGSGARTERGAGDGLGSTLNVPLPAGTGDEDYLDAFDRLVVPAVEDFDPDLIFLSAGFDLLWPDPLADLHITLTGLRTVIRRVATLADQTSGGRIVGVLEGGYDLGALSSGISNTIRLFEDADADLDDPIGPPQRPPERHRDYIDDLCRFFQGISVDEQNPVRANRMTNR